MQIKNARLQSALEFLSIAAPIICLVDCVVFPAALALLPLIGVHNFFHGVGDQILLLLVIAICAPTVTIGFMQHRRKSVLALLGLGFALIFFANFAGHILDNTLHLMITSAGSFCLIRANWQNRKLSKDAGCACHHSH